MASSTGKEAFRPYVEMGEVAPSETLAVRELLRREAIAQASRIVTAIDHQGRPGSDLEMPSILLALDRETDGLASRRVANMLRAFVEFLQADSWCSAGGELEAVLEAIEAEGSGGYALTSPALLVIQAIVHSHMQWPQVEHHEFYSAWAAYRHLANLVPSHRCFVTGVITFQTLLRAAWNLRGPDGQLLELQIFDAEKRLVLDPAASSSVDYDQRMANALARTLFRFLDPAEPGGVGRAQLAAAAVLCSLCLEFRHQRIRQPDPKLAEPGSRAIELQLRENGLEPERVARALSFCQLLCRAQADSTRLLFCQFGHRVMRYGGHDANGWKGRLQKFLRRRKLRKQELDTNFTFSFSPTVHQGYWKRKPIPWALDPAPFDIEAGPHADSGEAPAVPEAPVAAWINGTVGQAQIVGPEAGERVPLALGLETGEVDAAARTLDVLRRIYDQLRARYAWADGGTGGAFGAGYFPVPLVGYLLRVLHEQRPADFTLLRLRPIGLPAEVSRPRWAPFLERPFTIPVPRVEQEVELRPDSVESIVARYVAAMVINLESTLAPLRIDLDFFVREQRDYWQGAVTQTLNVCGHDGILDYINLYRGDICGWGGTESLRFVERGEVAAGSLRVQLDSRTVLGLDIGAGSIKCGLFNVSDGRLCRDAKDIEYLTLPTAREKRYQNADDFARFVIGELHKASTWLDDKLLAVGIAWPGAIRDGARVASTSGILKNFEKLTGFSSKDEARLVHALDLGEAFREALGKKVGAVSKPTEQLVVTVLNDGAADLKAEEETEPAGTEGIAVVLKAGSGTACGIYVDRKPVPILAEMGKTILNLEPSRPDSLKLAFPSGLMNLFCSKKTLPAIAAALGWQLEDPDPALDALDVAYFLARATRAPTAALEIAIGRRLIFERFPQYFSSPGEIPAKKAASQLSLYSGCGSLSATAVARRRLKQVAAAAGGARPGGGRAARKLALRCAEIAGMALADAIALLVDLLRCRVVRLAGGPWSMSTGQVIAARACDVLEEHYGFEVERLDAAGYVQEAGASERNRPPKPEPVDKIDPHVLSSVPKLWVQFPPQTSTAHTGETGAAQAALEALLEERQRDHLARARSALSEDWPGTKTAAELVDHLAGREIYLTPEQVESLLEAFMASLHLTEGTNRAGERTFSRR